MRPERLTMRGFGVFSGAIEIDFTGVDVFALTGPTGSGKTTILDGICFALFGSVPRHGGRDVAPIITQGLNEAAVALEFLVGDQKHTVARLVRKNPKGKTANTDEATLERDGLVLANGADAVTVEVKTLLGLDFEQFTTCVLLPQGDFQRFLHDKPADRQNLLSALLDLGIYERIGQAAAERRSLAEGRLQEIDLKLQGLGEMTAKVEDDARQRVSLLEALLTWVEATQPALDQLEAAQREAASEAEQLDRWLQALTGLTPPPDLETLSADRTEVIEELAKVQARLTTAEEALAAAEAVLAGLPAAKQLTQWQQAWTAIRAQRLDLTAAATELEEVRKSVARTTEALEQAREASRAAGELHRVAHLRAGLAEGSSCPVCEQVITRLPASVKAPEIEQARHALELAEGRNRQTTEEAIAAEKKVLLLGERIVGLERQVSESPPEDELEDRLGGVGSAVSVRDQAKQSMEQAKKEVAGVDKRRLALADRERQARLSLQAARDRIAGLQPPALDLDDPVQDWKSLATWAEATGLGLVSSREKGVEKQSELTTRLQQKLEEMNTRLEAAAVATAGRQHRDAAVDALTAARSRLGQIEQARAQATGLEKERKSVVADQAVAALLVKHLRNDTFRKWVLDEVFAALVVGANQNLDDLTRGQYSLDMSGREFEVIDNFSAGNRRSVKTLSGGETFLVSLALALALADQVAEASVGGVQIDAIFLDEGFGTLDGDTLEVVATVIAELGASGKMVGIVTHVPELAEQMPVRYQLAKGKGGATVEVIKA
jgi:exonuclease SbcC